MQSGSLHTDDDKPIKNRKGVLSMDSYEKIKQKVARQENFNGNSAWAKHTDRGYEVYSYNTLICRISEQEVFYDNRFYSMTTRRIQGIIHRAFNDSLLKDFPFYEVGKRGGVHSISESGLKVFGFDSWDLGDYGYHNLSHYFRAKEA